MQHKWFVCFLWLVGSLAVCGVAQEGEITEAEGDKAHYCMHPDSYRRSPGPFNEIASNAQGEITLQDWLKGFLSEDSFVELDKDKNNTLSRKELDEDPVLGEAKEFRQTDSLIDKYCAQIPDYKIKINQLKTMGYTDIDEPVVYYLSTAEEIADANGNPKIHRNDKNEVIYNSDSCEYFGCQEARTKTYVDVKKGKPVVVRVCTGHYAALTLEKHFTDSYTPYILGLMILAMVTAGIVFIGHTHDGV